MRRAFALLGLELERALQRVGVSTMEKVVETVELAAPAATAVGTAVVEGGPKKKRFAVLFGYSGQKYHGLQMNPDFPTVEAALFKAIVESGAVKEDNQHALQKIGWNRAARTDKGVHALGNVVSAKLMVGETQAEIDEYKEKLQNLLPQDIKVFDLIRTTKSFNSKIQCSARIYEYVLPSYYLAPLETWGGLFENKEMEDDNENDKNGEEGEGEGEAQADDLTNNSSFAQFSEMIKGYKASAEDIQRFRTVASGFIGTRNFHNFSPKATFGENSSKRYIVDVTVDEPFDLGGVEYVRFVIRGQSFMLNQIRKMVGTAVEIARRKLDPQVLDQLFFMSERRPTPMIPGEGLLLRACIYDPYNDRYSTIGTQNDADKLYPPIDFLRNATDKTLTEFRDTQIYPLMLEQEKRNMVFVKWIYRQGFVAFPGKVLPPKVGAITDAQVKAQKRKHAESKQWGTKPLTFEEETEKFLSGSFKHFRKNNE